MDCAWSEISGRQSARKTDRIMVPRRLVTQVCLREQAFEARVGAHGVQPRIHLHVPDPRRLLVESPLQPRQPGIDIAKCDVDESDVVRRDMPRPDRWPPRSFPRPIPSPANNSMPGGVRAARSMTEGQRDVGIQTSTALT